MEWPDECRIVCTFDYSQMSIIEITSVFANPIVVLKEREGCTCRYQESGYNTTLKTHFILTLISSSICCNCFSYSCFFVSSVSLYEAKYHLLPPWVAYWPCRACGKASSSPWNWATPSSRLECAYRFIGFVILHILLAILTYKYLWISSIE